MDASREYILSDIECPFMPYTPYRNGNIFVTEYKIMTKRLSEINTASV